MTENIKKYTLIFLLTATAAFAQLKKEDNDSKDKKVWENLNKQVSNIIDNEDVFTPEQELKLLEIVANYKKNRGIEFVIVTVADAEKFKSLSLDEVHKWDNDNAKDKGVMFAISKGLHRMRIQNGDRVKTKVSDAATRLIIDAFCIPQFQKDDYYQGVLDGMAEVIKRSR